MEYFTSAFYDFINKNIGKYIYGFNKKQAQINILTQTIRLNDVLLNTPLINQHLQKHNIPFTLKAGIITQFYF